MLNSESVEPNKAKEEKKEVIPTTPKVENVDFKPWGMDEKLFCTLMHISVFAGNIVPSGGIILPILMWFSFKDESEAIDKNGKNILNWMISAIIYSIGGAILSIIGIGVLVLIAVGVLTIVFAIKGAMAANKGEVYEYPLCFKFIK